MRKHSLVTVLWIGLWLAACFVPPQTAAAHPADEGRQEVVFEIRDGKLHWVHNIWMGPLVGLQVWAQNVDSNGDLQADAQEQRNAAIKLGALFSIRLNGQPVTMTLESMTFAAYPKFVGQPVAPQIEFAFSAPIQAGEYVLDYGSAFYPQKLKVKARFPSGNGVLVSKQKQSDGNYTSNVVIKSIALKAQPNPAQQPQTEAEAQPPTALSPAISTLIEGSTFSLPVLLLGLLVSFAVGATHALTPGHGKGIIAAYMIGDQMTTLRNGIVHALVLASVMTLTHTASVIGIGLLAIALSRFISSEILLPYLSLVSGLMIAFIGAALLWRRLRRPQSVTSNNPSVPHDPNLAHSHTKIKLSDMRTMNLRALFVLGISGGLLPCADALAILLLAVSVNRASLGIVLLLAFSLGIALTLTALGITAAAGQRTLHRYTKLEPILAKLPLVSAVFVLGLGVVLVGQAVAGLRG